MSRCQRPVDLVVDEGWAELVLRAGQAPDGVLLFLAPGLVIVAGRPGDAAALRALVSDGGQLAREVDRRSQPERSASGRNRRGRVVSRRCQVEPEVVGAVALLRGGARQKSPQ